MARNRRNRRNQPSVNRWWASVLHLLEFFFHGNLRTRFFRGCIYLLAIMVFFPKLPNTFLHVFTFSKSKENVVFPVQDDGISSEIYHSREAFRRDYAEMEMKFRVFVYADGGKVSVCDSPSKLGGKYGSEGYFFKNIRERFSTDDPKKAHMFFLPISCHALRKQGQSQEDVTNTVQNFVHMVINKYPYWNRTSGADHFFVTCHEPAITATATDTVSHLMNNSTRVTCSSSHEARCWDISLPQIVQPFAFPAGGNFVENRTILGFWAGRRSSKLRDTLINLWQHDKELDIQNYIVDKSTKGHLSYQEKFFRSKFCICPDGSNVHGGRLATAIRYGCVPVIFSDNYNLPFNDVLDWRKFSVILKERHVYHLKNILKRIPDAKYKQMQKNTIEVQKHFEWNSPPVTLDAFHMAMYELWLRHRDIKY